MCGFDESQAADLWLTSPLLLQQDIQLLEQFLRVGGLQHLDHLVGECGFSAVTTLPRPVLPSPLHDIGSESLSAARGLAGERGEARGGGTVVGGEVSSRPP